MTLDKTWWYNIDKSIIHIKSHKSYMLVLFFFNWKITIVLCAVATVCFGTQVFPVHRPVCTHYTLIFYQAVDMTLFTYWLQLKQRWPDFLMSKKKNFPLNWGGFFFPSVVFTVWTVFFYGFISGYCSLDIQRDNLVSPFTCRLHSVSWKCVCQHLALILSVSRNMIKALELLIKGKFSMKMINLKR